MKESNARRQQMFLRHRREKVLAYLKTVDEAKAKEIAEATGLGVGATQEVLLSMTLTDLVVARRCRYTTYYRLDHEKASA